MLRLRHYRYAWRDGNEFQLLCDSDQFFPTMLQAIANARELVCLEMYLFESGLVSDAFITAFLTARERGVTVFLLLDDFGSRKLNRDDRQRLTKAGVEIVYYNPVHYGHLRRSLFRDHRKILVVDDEIAFVGGAGITDEFSSDAEGKRYWRETMVQVRGPCVYDWFDLFASVWLHYSKAEIPLPLAADHAARRYQMAGRVVCTRMRDQEIMRSFYKRVYNAERRAWIATAYFVPSRKLRRALRRAASQGVDVRLLLPGPFSDHPAVRHAGRRFYSGLMRAGVRIFEYQPRFLHQKIIVCDQWTSIGSSNIDRWNLRWNLEANQEVDDATFAQNAVDMFERDFAESLEIDPVTWHQRSAVRRWLEWFWGQVDIWLDRFSTRR